jgi:hypothetical protein
LEIRLKMENISESVIVFQLYITDFCFGGLPQRLFDKWKVLIGPQKCVDERIDATNTLATSPTLAAAPATTPAAAPSEGEGEGWAAPPRPPVQVVQVPGVSKGTAGAAGSVIVRSARASPVLVGERRRPLTLVAVAAALLLLLLLLCMFLIIITSVCITV